MEAMILTILLLVYMEKVCGGGVGGVSNVIFSNDPSSLMRQGFSRNMAITDPARQAD